MSGIPNEREVFVTFLGYTWLVAFVAALLALKAAALIGRARWEYGLCCKMLARRSRRSGAVQFILWRAGEEGQATDYWHSVDRSHWANFQSFEAGAAPKIAAECAQDLLDQAADRIDEIAAERDDLKKKLQRYEGEGSKE